MRLFKIGDTVQFCGPPTTQTGEPDPRVGKTGKVISERFESPDGKGSFKTLFDGIEYLTRDDFLFEPPSAVPGAAPQVPPYGTYVDYQTPDQIIETKGVVEPDAAMPVITEHLTCTPATISFNKDLFVSYALSITRKYAGLVLTADNETEIKAIVANLNKAAKELNQHRIEEEKRLTANVKQFKTEVDEVIAIFSKSADDLKKQLENAASQAKESKRAEIQPLLKEFLAQSGLPPEYQQHIIIKEEYLNKTFSMKKVKDDIKAEIAQQQEYYHNAQAAKELEQVKAREREITFNAFKQAYPRVKVMLADLIGLEPAQFADYFAEKAKQVDPVPAMVPLTDVLLTAPDLSLNPAVPPQQVPVPDSQPYGEMIAPAKTYSVTLIIKSIDEMAGLQFGLDTVKRAEELGLVVELV